MSESLEFNEPTQSKPDWLRDGEARLRDYESQERIREQEKEEAKKSPYTRRGGFTQLNDSQIINLRLLTMENPTAAGIFLFLTEHMSNYNAVACSHSLLMKVTGKGRTTVSKAISVLKKMNFIGIKKVGTTQVFHLNANIVWHSYGDRVKYAELMAPILLDFEENPELQRMKVEKGKVNMLSISGCNEEG